MNVTTSTLDIMRDYLNNQNVTLNAVNQVCLEETHQTLGQVFESEEEVTEHLRTLCLDSGNEWNGVESASLYNEPQELNAGLRYIGNDVWYQSYR